MKVEFSTTPYSVASAAIIGVVVQAVETVNRFSGTEIIGWTAPYGVAAPLIGGAVFVLLEAISWLARSRE
jgi:LDH2 family malate/lactate/ureidoglycolate dehydrogenase